MNSLVTLFCGAGGLDLGFHLTKDYNLKFANEILEKPLTAYSKNIDIPVIKMENFNGLDQNVAILGDVQKFNFSMFDEKATDVVVGGPPCQDFSMLRGKNKRQGIEVKRGKLYSHFVRALVHIQPKIFVFENVPGLVSANKGKAYEVINKDFENLSLRWKEVSELVEEGSNLKIDGYELIFNSVIKMTSLGVPQARKRLIIIGVRKDQIDNAGDLFISENIVKKALKGANELFWKYPLTPIEVLEGNTLDKLDSNYREIMMSYEGVWNETKSQKSKDWKKNIWDKSNFNIIKDYQILNKIKNFDEHEFKEALKQHKKVLKKLEYYQKPVVNEEFKDDSNKIPGDQKGVIERMKRIPPGANFQFVEGTEWQVKGLMSGIYRRIHPIIPAPTVIAYGGGGTWGYHYRKDRSGMTNRERARLQTFPDFYLFEGSRQEMRAQIGEAVPPLAANKIAEAVTEVMKDLKME